MRYAPRAVYQTTGLAPQRRGGPAKVDGRHTATHIRTNDATALEILRRWIRGESVQVLSAEYGISQRVIRHWCSGEMRGHLLLKAERERYL